MKIATIVGCRPQFIKAAVVSQEFSKDMGIQEVIIHTGQHYDSNMSEVFFKQLGIPEPKYNLEVNSGTTGKRLGQMIAMVEVILLAEQPDYVLVYGDTDSTLAGALAAKKIGIKIIHVEAGLRDRDRDLPEEINRILTDNVSDLLLCPTIEACENLMDEGINTLGSIHFVGDVMYDSVLRHLPSLPEMEGGYILCTIHRQHNMNNIDTIIEFLKGLPNVLVVAHPRVINEFKQKSQLRVIESVDYLSMLALIKGCDMVVTDSGGLQKEAFFLKKKCLVLNKTTGWNELVKGGTNELIEEMNVPHLRYKFTLLSEREVNFDGDYYGTGTAGEDIIYYIKEHYDRSNSSTATI